MGPIGPIPPPRERRVRRHHPPSEIRFMLRNALLVAALAVVLVVPAWLRGEATYSLKVAESAVPEGVAKDVAELLGPKTVQLLDDKGAVMCELWFRKELPSNATEQQAKSGLTYAEIQETTLVGVIKLSRLMTDYRKNKIKE